MRFRLALRTAHRRLSTELLSEKIVLDTNNLSELMRPVPDPVIGRWMSVLGETSLSTTTVTISEIAFGLERLEDGRRKSDFIARFDQLIAPASDLTVLPFDEAAAFLCGKYRALRESGKG